MSHKRHSKILYSFSFVSVADPLKQFLRPQSSGIDFPSYANISYDRISRPSQDEEKHAYSGNNGLEEEKKPDLMPPAMFTNRDNAGQSGLSSQQNLKPEPLTRNQLLQAFDYLLRNDADFIKKIHEAYVKSLTEKLL